MFWWSPGEWGGVQYHFVSWHLSCSRWWWTAAKWLAITWESIWTNPPQLRVPAPENKPIPPTKRILQLSVFQVLLHSFIIVWGDILVTSFAAGNKNGRFRVRSGEDGISLLPSGKSNIAGWSICIVSIGNTSSIWVHFPASHVSLPECTSVWSPMKSSLLRKVSVFLTLAWGLRLNIFVEMT